MRSMAGPFLSGELTIGFLPLAGGPASPTSWLSSANAIFCLFDFSTKRRSPSKSDVKSYTGKLATEELSSLVFRFLDLLMPGTDGEVGRSLGQVGKLIEKRRVYIYVDPQEMKTTTGVY